MIKAYSYIRFSTVEQSKGNSLSRQLALSEKYAQENNLYIDKTLNMKDLGISAFKGANVSNGALGTFIEAIDAGTVSKGSYLLVESLDRLSRQTVMEALTQFLSIISKGIVIVTLSDNKKYETENIREMDLMFSLMIMSRAHEESKTKSLRIQAAWDNKHKNIENKKLTAWAPKWVYLSDDKKEFLLHDDRVKIVKNIFQWSVDGLGTNLIVQRLEQLGIEPWTSVNANEPKRRAPKRWYVSYIQRILTDRSVLGEFLSHRNSNSYEIIENYFPKIISKELFYKVKHLRESRNVNNNKPGAGRKGKYVSNLFSGILYCGYSIDGNRGKHRCDGTNEKYNYTNKGDHLTYLQCARIKSGSSGCTSCRKMWRYDAFEKSFLTHIDNIDVSTLLGTTIQIEEEILKTQNEEKSLKGELTEIESNLIKFTKIFFSDDNPAPETILQSIRDFEARKTKIETNLIENQNTLYALIKDKDKITSKSNELKETIKLMQSVSSNEKFAIRLKLSQIIKQSIDKVLIYSKGRVIGDQYLNRVKEKLGQEAYEALILNQKINQPKSTPFFEVFYKSGISRLVIPDSEDPTKLNVRVTSQDDKVIEITHRLGGELKMENENNSV